MLNRRLNTGRLAGVSIVHSICEAQACFEDLYVNVGSHWLSSTDIHTLALNQIAWVERAFAGSIERSTLRRANNFASLFSNLCGPKNSRDKSRHGNVYALHPVQRLRAKAGLPKQQTRALSKLLQFVCATMRLWA